MSENKTLTQMLAGCELRLDEMVRSCKGDEAAAINNDGVAEQVAYLLCRGLSPEAILAKALPLDAETKLANLDRVLGI